MVKKGVFFQMDKIFEVFRCALNEVMDTRRISQAHLSRELGCSNPKIHSIRKGKRKLYENDSRRVASILGFTSYEAFLDIGRAKLGLPIVTGSYEVDRSKYFQSADQKCAKYHELVDVLLHVEKPESECWKQGLISVLMSLSESALITEARTINADRLRNTLNLLKGDNAACNDDAIQKPAVEMDDATDAVLQKAAVAC
jgi:hypothetical protein